MQFKLASIILLIFSLIGGVLLFSLNLDVNLTTAVFICLFVLVPAYGAYGVWHKSRLSMSVVRILFVTQCIRLVGNGSLLPNFRPISFSVPFGNFAQGSGYLIDIFAIFMALYLAYLLKLVINIDKTA